MSRYSDLIETGSPVRILEGERIAKVGLVEAIIDDIQIVSVDGIEVAFRRNQLEPLFDLEQGVQLKLPEVSDGAVLADRVKPFGLSTQDLAEFSAEFITEAVARVKGVGDQQYSQGSFQKFEEMSLDDLLVYAEEEVLDIANYSAMLFIRIRRLRQALEEADDLGKGTEEEYEGGNVTADDFKEEQ